MKKRFFSNGIKLSVTVLSAVLLFAGLASCSGGDEAAAEKTIYIGQVNPPITFNPLNSPDIGSQYDQGPMFDSLLGMVKPLEFEPMLADTFELKDPTTLYIKLNDKAKWTDGESITAEDVAFTLNLLANPKTETNIGTYIAQFAGLAENGKLPEGETELSSIKVLDEKSLEITLKQAIDLNMIREQLGTKLFILPKHVLKDADPAEFAQLPYFLAPDVTSGPYKFVTYEKDQFVQYVANEDYYRGAPKIKNMYIKLVPSTNLATQLETGEIHFNTGLGIGLFPSTDFDTVKEMDGIWTKTEPNTSVQMMLFNVGTITDPKVRQAIVYALDRETILNKLLKGSGEVVDPPYTSLNPYLNKDIPQYTYDPGKAKAMLEEAGWDFDRTINLVVPIGNKDREQSANIITQNLTEIGLKIEMTKYDFPTIMQKGRVHDFDLLLIGNNFLLDPDGISVMVEEGAGLNFSDYHNKEFSDYFVKGRIEPDPAVRRTYYNEIQKIMHEELPLITLYSYQELLGVSNKLIKGEPRFYGTFYDVNEWDLAE